MNQTWTIQLQADPAGVDRHGREPVYRLRLALKRLLRNYGFRCVAMKQDASERAKEQQQGTMADRPIGRSSETQVMYDE